MTTGVKPQPESHWYLGGQLYTNIVLTLILFLLCYQLRRDMDAGPVVVDGPVEVELVGKPWVLAEVYTPSPIPVSVLEMPDVTVDEIYRTVSVSIDDMKPFYDTYGLPVDVQNLSLRVR